MKSKILGGALLIIGTSIGAGMLAQPVVTAGGGYWHSLWLLIGIWSLTLFSAFLILEVNLWFPENANLVSMARKTLGYGGEVVTWLIYLLLLYTLVATYISGGSDLLHYLFTLIHVQTAQWVDSILFVLILGSIVFYGVKAVDWSNRGLMTVKLGAFLLLVVLILPHVNFVKLETGRFSLLSSAVMVVVTSFGYGTIIPTLRSYFKSNVNALRLVIFLGSLTSLLCYLLWDFVVQGTLIKQGPTGLVHMAVSGHVTSELTKALVVQLNNVAISELARLFSSLCVTTSFLGVALCLSDFLTDGLKRAREGMDHWLIIAIVFIPPLIIVLFFPGAFLTGLSLGGVLCVILLMLLPALMAWRGRYVIKISSGYRVWGGKLALALEIIIATALLIYGFFHLNF